jgi:hypothetical protein
MARVHAPTAEPLQEGDRQWKSKGGKQDSGYNQAAGRIPNDDAINTR